ncbi:thioester reductase [Streptomyces pluripotens]|uniref:Thioester reductase n=1 Tax=Streptomyces pluripotens TaxID=1355015 RepID=A0A221NTU4_9ACTN|nr:amino acid adenylation domain-containing protein [Streptomyces pluripotens]ARP69127.1 thioester reductase [Streptomyces pluripotens]ASN23387.1 thioester reductase [Streptomyces pluripotens]
MTMQPIYVPDLLRAADAVPEGTPAVLSADGELSYRDLWDQVAAVARQLRSVGVEPGDHVALYLPRSAGYVSALIAVMTIGAVAVPMDPEFPADRLVQVIAAAKPRVILREDDNHPAALGPAAWLAVETQCRPGDAESLAAATWRERPAREQTAVILFTSGSTGRPKGVRLHHAGLCNRLEWGHQHYRMAQDDRVLHKASHAFDAAIHEIFSPLIAGGTLVIAPPGLQFDSLGIVRLIQEAEVTTAHFVPSVLRYVLDEDELAYCTSLRRVFCGGEALDMTLVRRFRSLLPAELYNGYGPTETSVNATYWDCSEPYDGDIAPVGRPIGNVACHILGEDLAPVPAGETGELWISGIGVGGGYLDDDALTAERFRPDPFASNGTLMYRTGDRVRQADAGYLEFRGRIDDQVKVRGVRVEPEEVGTVIRRHPLVHDAAVVGLPDGSDGVRLVAYVAAKPVHSPLVGGLSRTELPNGLAVATPSPDEALFLYRQIFEEDEYARFGLRISTDAVIVDVGANIGLFSLWAARQADGVRVVAVEPNPDTLPYLTANLKLNGVSADLVPMAVTDRSGTATLTSFPQLSYLSGLGPDREAAAAELVQSHYRTAGAGGTGTANETELAQLRQDTERRLAAARHQVPTTDLSTIFDRFELDAVDLLKINTEGAELDVLRGLRPEHWPRVRQVCLEVERASTVGPDIRKILTNAGFSLYEIDDWNVDTTADVTYVYATRETHGTPPAARVREAHKGPGLLTAREIRRHAAAHLPSAMQPSQVVFVENLPRLPNGKVAKLQLPAPPAIPAPAADTPADGITEQLRELWREVLSVDAVGDDDDFLSLGGHSLLALRVTARARSIVHTDATPSACLKAPTFAEWLAEVLHHAPAVKG